MKHTVIIKIGATPEITGHVYIEARSVRALSPERIEADGVIIDLPGNIEAVLTPNETATPRPPDM